MRSGLHLFIAAELHFLPCIMTLRRPPQRLDASLLFSQVAASGFGFGCVFYFFTPRNGPALLVIWCNGRVIRLDYSQFYFWVCFLCHTRCES